MEPPNVDGTFLTERQAEVLAMRERGLTQREIADRIETSGPNVSSVESTARHNVDRARRTVTLARLLAAVTRVRAGRDTDVRELVDRTFAAGDEAGVRIAYSDPELAAHLRDHLAGRLENRRLTEDVVVGIAADGDVATHPSAVLPDASERWVTGND